MKQIYFIILFLTIAISSINAQTCVAPSLVNTSPSGGSAPTDPVGFQCSGGTANVSATFNNGTAGTIIYGVTSIPFNFTTFSGTVIPSGSDDVWSNVITMPFSICFYGNTYNQLVIGSNGIVSFDITYANGFCPWQLTPAIPSTTYPRACIMGVYNDIDPRFGGPNKKIQYTTIGSAPCREFIISFEDIAYYGSTCPGNNANFQIVIHETSNIVDVQIQNHFPCSSTNAGRGTIGVQNYAQNIGFAPPGRNAVVFSATNEAWRFLPADTSNPFRRLMVHLFDNGVLVDSAAPYYTSFPAMCADFTRNITFPPDTHRLHVELVVYDSTNTSGSGTALCPINTTTIAGAYNFNDMIYYNAGSLRVTNDITNVTCFGFSDGAIDLSAITSAPPISFNWSNGSPNEDISGLSAGTYSVTASDGGGCTIVQTYTVTEPPELLIMSMNTMDVTCRGGTDGMIEVMTMGGTLPYAPLWNNGVPLENLYGAPAGYYCLTVIDSHNCIANYCDTIHDGTIDSTVQNIKICFGDSILINGIQRGTNGTYADTFVNARGCDSIHTIILTIGNKVYTTLNRSICLGDTVVLLGTRYYLNGSYSDSTLSSNGCDSVITLNLTVNNPSNYTQNIQKCLGQSITVGSNTYNTNGTYYDTLINIKGCDSAITTILTIKLPSSSLIDTTLCFGDFIIVGNTTFNNPDTTIITLTNTVGCDSIITVRVAMHPNTNTVDSVNICIGQSTNNITPTNDTSLISNNTNRFGCDSTHTIYIIVNDLPNNDLGGDRNIYTGDTVILTASGGNTYSWSNGATTRNIVVSPTSTTVYSVTLTNNAGCIDSGQVIVNVFPNSTPIAIPSAFTPNGDNLNDYYYPILTTGSILKNMFIFNRWGQIIYSGTLTPGWDGNINGIPAPIGNYVYYIEVLVPDPANPLNFITETYNGTITLLR